MRNKHYFTKVLFATTAVIFFSVATAVAQCTIPIPPGQSYIEDFQSGEMECWTVETTSSATWAVMQGIWLGEEAMLVSAPLDITAVTKPVLTFKHRQRSLGQFVDELSVWYAPSINDYWHLLGEFTSACEDWEEVTFDLPEASDAYLIAFKAKSNEADGVYVDDVRVGNYIDDGVEEVASFAVSVSPNPTSGSVTIASNSADGEVTVIDLFGRKVASAIIHEGRTEVDLSSCAKGVYMARISSEAGTRTIKLVKE